MIARLCAFLKDKSGVTAIEYGLIAALVGVAIIGGVTALGDSLNDMFDKTSDTQQIGAGLGGHGFVTIISRNPRPCQRPLDWLASPPG